LLAARTTLLRVRSEARVQRVNVYLALGGSFELPNDAPPAARATDAAVAAPASAGL
jgi:hypothetical protein